MAAADADDDAAPCIEARHVNQVSVVSTQSSDRRLTIGRRVDNGAELLGKTPEPASAVSGRVIRRLV